MDAIDWTAAGTLVALGLGLLSILFGYWLPHRREMAASRRAALEVWYEYYWRPDTNRMQERLLIVNHGPHRAQDVDVTEMSSNSDIPVDLRGAMVGDALPARVLQPGQAHSVILEWSLDDATPGRATVAWTDGDGRHDAEYVLSPFYV